VIAALIHGSQHLMHKPVGSCCAIEQLVTAAWTNNRPLKSMEGPCLHMACLDVVVRGVGRTADVWFSGIGLRVPDLPQRCRCVLSDVRNTRSYRIEALSARMLMHSMTYSLLP
jgi:hypothetical protein